MSIQTELTRITNAKAAIKTAIEGKGVTVPDGTLLDGMASLIESIEAGGGNVTCKIGTVTPEADILLDNIPYTIQHNLGRIPKAFFIYASSRDAWGSDKYSVLFAFGFEIDAGGIPTVITSGYCSNDGSSNKLQSASMSYGVAYKKNKTLQTATESINNLTISIYGATEEIIEIKYVNPSGSLKGGWTYTWIAI